MRVNNIVFILIGIILQWNISYSQSAKKGGIIDWRLSANDSMHVATVIVTDSVAKTPLKGVELTFYVKRTFGLMKVGSGTTDTTGIAVVDIPLSIPGSDSSRKVTIVAMAEDDKIINDVSSQTIAYSPLPFPKDKALPREMISSRAPWWLVITFSLGVGVVWLLFAYVVYLIYRIKKSALSTNISLTAK